MFRCDGVAMARVLHRASVIVPQHTDNAVRQAIGRKEFDL